MHKKKHAGLIRQTFGVAVWSMALVSLGSVAHAADQWVTVRARTAQQIMDALSTASRTRVPTTVMSL
jgi:hypothetical protein